jgi:hypothetical protein
MENFWSKVEKTDFCWNWKASSRGNGYGAFKYKKKVVDAHRVSFMLTKGEIPKGMYVCHKCDNRSCVNPDHLFLGTHRDNMIDCFKKGRMFIPENQKFRFTEGNIPKNRKLDLVKVLEIKEAIKTKGKKPLTQIAKEFGVSIFIVYDIVNRKNYKNIEKELSELKFVA